MNHPEPSCTDEHKTLEAVCLQCGRHGDAVCPHCGCEYGPDAPVEDYGFKPSTPQEMMGKFAELARMITAKRNAKFWWACFLMTTGDAAAGGVSMDELGKRYGVGKACVSQTCIAICASLGIPPSQYMKKEESRESYRRSNRRNTKCGI